MGLDTLEVLSKDDLHELSDAGTSERTALLIAAQDRIAAELTRTVRHADLTQAPERNGLTSMRSWLIGHARLSPAEAEPITRSLAR